MLRVLRLRRAHAKFLASSRSLEAGIGYWGRMSPPLRWLLESVLPVPLLGLHPDGTALYGALRWLEENCRRQALTEETIRHYHRMLDPGGPEAAGAYRSGKASVIGSRRPGAAPDRVPLLMKQLDLHLREEQKRLDESPAAATSDVFGLAVSLYHRLGSIHPFPDANGRVARLSMNHVLRRYGRGYVIFPSLGTPGPLWNALEEASQGKPAALLNVAMECEVRL